MKRYRIPADRSTPRITVAELGRILERDLRARDLHKLRKTDIAQGRDASWFVQGGRGKRIMIDQAAFELVHADYYPDQEEIAARYVTTEVAQAREYALRREIKRLQRRASDVEDRASELEDRVKLLERSLTILLNPVVQQLRKEQAGQG